MTERLAELFTSAFGLPPQSLEPLRAHGSNRKLYRLSRDGRSAIGVIGDDADENAAFLGFSRHFRAAGLAVPEIYAEDRAAGCYLEEDLGDTTLFELMQRERAGRTEIPEIVASVYEESARRLAHFQVEGARGLDTSLCHPHAAFDRRSMLWDLNYFKYYFLKLAGIPFNERRLENDFEAFISFLLEEPLEHFLYRDFQSRNIMVRDGKPWFIDYQGGRRGALQYDVASLLLDAKADLPLPFRERIKACYLDELATLVPLDREAWERHYRGFCLIRLMQAMGAYGYRGFFERKTSFLQSVPYAIRNLEALMSEGPLQAQVPALWEALQGVVGSPKLRVLAHVPISLTVRIESFSYKQGYPVDDSGHGGGFVFDCRVLPNPGKEERFKQMTGLDAPVSAWLEAQPETGRFVAQVRGMLEPVIESYTKRGFTHLSVAFGCTGGQHRSVWCAEQLAALLRKQGGLTVDLRHRQREAWPKMP